jgi:colicin import membrane protein
MSATLTHEPNRLPAGILALAVHGAFFSLLYFGFNWQTSQPAAMRVELWQSLPEEVTAPPVEPKVQKVEPPPRPQQPEPQRKIIVPDIALPNKKKPVPLEPVPVEKVKPKQVETKPVEKVSQAEIAAQQAASEQARVAEQAAREQAEQAAREAKIRAEKDAATNREVDKYKAKIQAKIHSNVMNPPDVAKDARAEFTVTLLPGGAVLRTELRKSSGNDAYDKAVERAILKSDPLPLPPDAGLFNRFRELNLVFKPTE